MRCDEARRRLLAHAWDHEASRHLESCVPCFEALESVDPLAHALRGARPADVAAPEGLTAAVLARRSAGARRLSVAAAVGALLFAAAGALELLAGMGPAWLGAALGGAAGALAPLVAVRDILAGQPLALTAFGAVTAAVCVLWLRLVLRPPVWRAVR